MKTAKMLTIALSAIMLASLVGCASERFDRVGGPITVGDKTYTALITERVNPMAGNAVTLTLVESEQKTVGQRPCPPPAVIQRPCPPPCPPPPMYYDPEPRHDRRPQPPIMDEPRRHRDPCPEPRPEPTVVYVQVPVQAPVACPPPPCTPCEPRVELTHTRVVNNNNQGSIGWVNGAMQGAVGDTILGGSMIGAAAVLRPAHIAGGGAAAASISSSVAASSP